LIPRALTTTVSQDSEQIMSEAYVVAALRTAGGRRDGRLRSFHPADLAAIILDALVAHVNIDPTLIEDVILGCVGQIGEQAANIARGAVLASSLPHTVPGTSVDRQCGSSQQALHFAASTVMSNAMDVVIAGGVESMSRVPMGLAQRLPAENGFGRPKSPRIELRYPNIRFDQFASAETIAKKYGMTRQRLDDFAYHSHIKAAEATNRNVFADEIVEMVVDDADGHPLLHRIDEGIRFDVTLDAIGKLKPLRDDGICTAGTASQICDGASGILIANERGLKAIGADPIARIHHMSVTAGDPVIMLEEPIHATRRALQRAGMTIDEIALYEVNEAFAPIPLAWLENLAANPERLNVHGGGIALGHPLGATGTKLMTTMIHALRRRRQRYGLQTMCEGGGMANVTIVERL
jgi:acetyl-CoA C-acetyltransferase